MMSEPDRAPAGTTTNVVQRSFYLDSVALMRLTQQLTSEFDLTDAAVMVATPSNLDLMAQAGLLTSAAGDATANDVVIALAGHDKEVLALAANQALALLAGARTTSADSTATATSRPGSAGQSPMGLIGTARERPDTNIALISVPSEFAALEAHAALAQKLNVFLFTNNVSLTDELALKQRARDAGLIVMGPDCGTSIISGTPLGFANAVPTGNVGLVGATGTGLQEVSVLLGRAGLGTRHAIGVGGRDLHSDIGGISAHWAVACLAQDEATDYIVLISKPPAAQVGEALIRSLQESGKPAVACFMGDTDATHSDSNVIRVGSLFAAAQAVCKLVGPQFQIDDSPTPPTAVRAGVIRGFFCGGTLAAEVQVTLRAHGLVVGSNAPIAGVGAPNPNGHCILDVGAPEYTQGKAHPMIEPSVRRSLIRTALTQPDTAVVLADIVLGTGGHMDPAGELLLSLQPHEDDDAIEIPAGHPTRDRPPLIVNVCGIEGDVQGFESTCERLRAGGATVVLSAAQAARAAVQCLEAQKT
jgi:FdrA protein